MDEQPFRIALPTHLLSEVDAHLENEGSSRTRADFVREAVEQRLLELRLGEVAETRPPRVDEAAPGERLPQPPLAGEEADLSGDPLLEPRSLADTRLAESFAPTIAHEETVGFPIEPGPWFLHGRDYPSFWSLAWLARWADEGPVELGAFLREITHAAWTFAASLQEFTQTGSLKPTTTFPTNPGNRGPASQTFRASAIGGLIRRRDGSEVAVGPLPVLALALIYPLAGRPMIAPTEAGIELLSSLAGLSLELPHSAEQAEAFFNHIEDHAPADFDGFHKTLNAVGKEPNRAELIDALSDLGESKKLADVYTQAYVARSREWGLIEPKLFERRYRLTGLGSSLLDR